MLMQGTGTTRLPVRIAPYARNFFVRDRTGHASGSFAVHPPRTVPIRGRRTGLELIEPAKQRARGAVAGNARQRGIERFARLVPTAGAISCEPLGIVGTQAHLLL